MWPQVPGWLARLVEDGRSGRVERTPHAHGPPSASQLLFQESNPGVRYEYTIHRESDDHGLGPPPEFSWHYGPWTKCTVTCGTGEEGS